MEVYLGQQISFYSLQCLCEKEAHVVVQDLCASFDLGFGDGNNDNLADEVFGA